MRNLLLLAGISLMLPALAAPLQASVDKDGTVKINGERRFILGIYHAAGRGAEPKAENYQELAEAGFNLVNASGAQMDLAQQAGLFCWTTVGSVDLANAEASKEQLRQRIGELKDHPALAFYEQADEPAWSWMGEPGAKAGAPRVTAEQFKAAYEVIRGMDSNHLVYTNHAPTNLVKTLQAYNAGTDIVATDIYPVNPGGIRYMFGLFPDGYQGDYNDTYISQVGRYTEKMRAVAGPERPVFMVLQAFAWDRLLPEEEQRSEKLLYPSYGDARFMAFQAIIKGANGLVYWGSAFMPQPSEPWNDLKRVVRDVADLEPVVVQPNAKPELAFEYQEVGYGLDEGVQWVAKEHEGKLYLLTCNADKHRNQAVISGLGAWSRAAALNEGEGERALGVEGGTLSDTWERFGVHVYRLEK